VTAVLHAVEALPGDGRFAVTFRRPDGSDQTAVAQVSGEDVDVAEAGLPTGWTRGSAEYAALSAVVLALHAARHTGVVAPALTDVEGGWDVSLGNVVLDGGRPSCIAHGAMEQQEGARYECMTCGAAGMYPL
jgi:hypothetical protein